MGIKECRFQVGDRVRVARAVPSTPQCAVDLSDGGLALYEEYIGKTFVISGIVEGDDEEDNPVLYEMDDCDDCFYELELDWA